jgi:CAAX protease family protein
MRRLVKGHPVASFVVLAYALSWAAWVPLAVRGLTVSPGGTVTHFPGLLGPAIAAFAVVALTEGTTGVRRLLRRLVLVSKPPRRFFVYSLSPLLFLALALATLGLAHRPLPRLRDFGIYSGLPAALSLPVVLLLVFLVNGFGEETGWRGFALLRLQERFGPVKGTLLLALIWAAWHTPMFWLVQTYRSMSIGAIFGGFGLGLCAGAVVLARVLNRTDGSVLAVALWHTTYNLTAATAAAGGMIAAVTTTCVMAWAILLLIQEWRRPLPRSRLAVPAAGRGGGDGAESEP